MVAKVLVLVAVDGKAVGLPYYPGVGVGIEVAPEVSQPRVLPEFGEFFRGKPAQPPALAGIAFPRRVPEKLDLAVDVALDVAGLEAVDVGAVVAGSAQGAGGGLVHRLGLVLMPLQVVHQFLTGDLLAGEGTVGPGPS
jgi:hypothetical protein